MSDRQTDRSTDWRSSQSKEKIDEVTDGEVTQLPFWMSDELLKWTEDRPIRLI